MVKNKKCHSMKMAALVSAVVLAVSAAVSFAVPQVKAANGPCDTGDWAYAYINVRNGEESNLLFSSEGTNSIDGMSYDRESNTLTLNNYKSSTTVIVTNMMGDDFKINLVGDNEIGSIGSYGDAWGGSINICGNGSLVINADKAAVAEAITAEAVKDAGFDSLDAVKEDGTAFVFMGHGTSHTAKVSYSQMQTQMEQLGYDKVFIGTVEGEPEDTSCEAVIEKLKEAGYKKVILRPLMVVAGDHANNDMAGDDDDSWKSQFEASGAFDSIDTQIAGLGEIQAIQQLYVAHTQAAIDAE